MGNSTLICIELINVAWKFLSANLSNKSLLNYETKLLKLPQLNYVKTGKNEAKLRWEEKSVLISYNKYFCEKIAAFL